MAKLTKQEMFDRAYRGLAKQRWRQCVSESDSDECRYNGPNGMHCAWGHVDTRIPKSREGVNVYRLANLKVGLAAQLLADDSLMVFAEQIQSAHDDNSEPRGMREEFKALAKEHGLKIPRLAR